MRLVDSSCQFSLTWMINLLKRVISASKKDVIDRATSAVHSEVCLSLSQKSKRVFNLLLKTTLLEESIDPAKWWFIIARASARQAPIPQRPADWIDNSLWPRMFSQMRELAKFPEFKGLAEKFT